MESARLAGDADLPAVEAIAARYADEISDARGGALFIAREAGLDELGERAKRAVNEPDGLLVVGLYDNVVLGYALATIETLGDGRRLAVLEDLLVDPAARDAGIGEAIMDLTLRELDQAGCFGVDSRALPGDRGTKNFFESFGLKARLLIMHRNLEDDPPPTS